jgi:hypothetical protein
MRDPRKPGRATLRPTKDRGAKPCWLKARRDTPGPAIDGRAKLRPLKAGRAMTGPLGIGREKLRGAPPPPTKAGREKLGRATIGAAARGAGAARLGAGWLGRATGAAPGAPLPGRNCACAGTARTTTHASDNAKACSQERDIDNPPGTRRARCPLIVLVITRFDAEAVGSVADRTCNDRARKKGDS